MKKSKNFPPKKSKQKHFEKNCQTPWSQIHEYPRHPFQIQKNPNQIVMVRKSRKRSAPGPSSADKESPLKASRKASKSKENDVEEPSTSWNGKKKIAKVIIIFLKKL